MNDDLVNRQAVLLIFTDVLRGHTTLEDALEQFKKLPITRRDKILSHTETITEWELVSLGKYEDWSEDVFRCKKCGTTLMRKYLPCECPVCFYGMSKERLMEKIDATRI